MDSMFGCLQQAHCRAKKSNIFLIGDSYKINKETGSFIIIDLESNNTVAAGIII